MASLNNDLDENLIHSGNPQDSLLYIRRTLDAAGRLSTVSGSGIFFVGILALAAVLVNVRTTGAPWEAGAQPYHSYALAVLAALLVLSPTIPAFTLATQSHPTRLLFFSPALPHSLLP